MYDFRKNLDLKKIRKNLCRSEYIFLPIAIILLVLILLFGADIDGSLSTVSAAFFGAGAAFLLNILRSRKKKRKRNKSALVIIKYRIEKLLGAHRQLEEFIHQNDKKSNDNYFEWKNISIYHLSVLPHKIGTENLLFLLDCNKKGKETLDSIYLVLMQHQTIVNVLESRNCWYSSYLDKIGNRDEIPKYELKNIIGLRMFADLENYTKHLIKSNSEMLGDCNAAENKICDFIKNY